MIEKIRPIEVDSKIEKKEEEKINKIALVTASQVDLGIKALSSLLKQANFEVGKFNLLKEEGTYTEKELDQILEKLSQYDIIGITATDYHFDKIKLLVDAIKNKLGKPVILGGEHAMLDPEDCLNTGADAVCLGEGESGFIDLLNNWHKRFERVNKNFVVKEDDLKKAYQLRESPIHDLDKLPLPDFGYENYWFLYRGELSELSPEKLEDFEHHQIGHKDTIIYASDRGCPHHCTYCCNSEVRWVYEKSAKEQGKRPTPPVRKKSIVKIIEEMKELKNKNPQAKFLNLMNNDTAARSVEELQEFAELYKEKIGWPFYCMASPQQLAGKKGEQKIQALIDAGMTELNIGIQTNEKTNKEVFNRFQSDEMLVDTLKTINKFVRKNPEVAEKGKIDLFCDFIIHNPFETEKDVKDTIKLIQKFPTPFDQVSHTLYVGRTTRLRKMYENLQKQDKAKGKKTDVVLEDDNTQVSNFHDTEKFIDWLGQNRNFAINTICEFMAGRHDEKKVGRIPRHTKELLKLDIFENFLKNNSNFRYIVSKMKIDDDLQSTDFLTSNQVLEYLNENVDKTKKLFLDMHEKYPIRYTNQVENY